MSAVTLQGEIVHYEVLGRGRPLIFLHDWVGSWRYWIPTMQAVSISFRAYAIDLWGFGDTAKRPEMYAIDRQVELLDGFLENLGIAKVALIGHGLGSVVALAYAARHPEFVDRVMATSFPIEVTTINPRMRTATSAELADWLLGRTPGSEAARVEAPKADPRAIWQSIDNLQNYNLLDLSTKLNTACLFVYGEKDPAIQTPEIERLSALSDRTHFIFFETSGHFPMLDEVTKYNRLLADFLALSSGESPRQLQLKEEWKRRVR